MGGPFEEFLPVRWKPNNLTHTILSLDKNHGIGTKYVLHTPYDEINARRSPLDKVLVEYQIMGKEESISHTLYTFGDLVRATYDTNGKGIDNIAGELGERAARRVTKYFLQHYHPEGRLGKLFRNDFSKHSRDEYIVANTDRHVLKIRNYPNMVLLRKDGNGKFGYEPIAEIDGLFDYRQDGKQHLIVLESKIYNINSNPQKISQNIFAPLHDLFPKATPWYLVFGNKSKIFGNVERWKQLRERPIDIHRSLKRRGVNTLFFTFNESREDFSRMAKHIVNHSRIANELSVTLDKTILSKNEIVIYAGGEEPILCLRKEADGTWREHRGSR